MNATYASHALWLLNRDRHLADMRAELAADHDFPADEERAS